MSDFVHQATTSLKVIYLVAEIEEEEAEVMLVEIPEPPIEEEIVIIGEAPYFTTPVQDRYVRLRLSSGYIEPIYLGDIVVDAGENYDDIVQ